jgi:hypothetical protein
VHVVILNKVEATFYCCLILPLIKAKKHLLLHFLCHLCNGAVNKGQAVKILKLLMAGTDSFKQEHGVVHKTVLRECVSVESSTLGE